MNYYYDHNELITEEKASLYINNKYIYDGDILYIIMIANILSNNIEIENYGQTDLSDLKAHIKFFDLNKIKYTTVIEVRTNGYSQCFILPLNDRERLT